MLSIPDHVCPILFEMAALAVVYRQEKSVTAILWEEKNSDASLPQVDACGVVHGTPLPRG
jgi:hypothetical protein